MDALDKILAWVAEALNQLVTLLRNGDKGALLLLFVAVLCALRKEAIELGMIGVLIVLILVLAKEVLK